MQLCLHNAEVRLSWWHEENKSISHGRISKAAERAGWCSNKSPSFLISTPSSQFDTRASHQRILRLLSCFAGHLHTADRIFSSRSRSLGARTQAKRIHRAAAGRIKTHFQHSRKACLTRNDRSVAQRTKPGFRRLDAITSHRTRRNGSNLANDLRT